MYDQKMKNIEKEYPAIADFYAGKTVALTGGTGFLGQGIIEKLLRGSPEIKKIIILIRTKRGTSPQQRLENLAMKPAFDNLRQIDPNFHRKLACVSCDLEAKDLGLSREDRKTLRSEVNVFFHIAAILKFNEAVRLAFSMNVQCTRRILKLCKETRNLDAFVHVSTAYVNSDRLGLPCQEKIYPCKINYKDLQRSLNWMTDEAAEKLLSDILGDRPNTYTLTKAMAEDAIAAEAGNIPVCIVRPGIVTAAYAEPTPGWITNVYGPTAYVACHIKGICRTILADKDINTDFIPVDFVVNGLIAAAMKTSVDFPDISGQQEDATGYDSGRSSEDLSSSDETLSDNSGNSVSVFGGSQRRQPRKDIPVYHMTSCSVNPFRLGVVTEGCMLWKTEYPGDSFLPVHADYTWNNNIYLLRTWIIEYLPALYLDMLATMAGQRRGAVRTFHKIRTGMRVMNFFHRHDFDFEWVESKRLLESLTVKDQAAYNCSPAGIDWYQDYMKIYYRGIRKFILNEKTTDEQNRAKARKVAAVFDVSCKIAQLGAGLIISSFGCPSSIWDSTSYCYL